MDEGEDTSGPDEKALEVIQGVIGKHSKSVTIRDTSGQIVVIHYLDPRGIIDSIKDAAVAIGKL